MLEIIKRVDSIPIPSHVNLNSILLFFYYHLFNIIMKEYLPLVWISKASIPFLLIRSAVAVVSLIYETNPKKIYQIEREKNERNLN